MSFHVTFTDPQQLPCDLTDPMETVTGMIRYFAKLHRKPCLGLLLLQSVLPGAALLNELIVYIWSRNARRGGSRDEAGKTEQDIQEVLHERRGISCDDIESETKQIQREGKNSFILSSTCNIGGVILSLVCLRRLCGRISVFSWPPSDLRALKQIR